MVEQESWDELVCCPLSALSDTDREERVGLDLTFKNKKRNEKHEHNSQDAQPKVPLK